jgi:hypothetical protein
MKTKPILAFIFFFIGISLGIAITVIAIWGDFEAASYGFSNRASMFLKGLSCPILMTRDEVGNVKLKITNKTDRNISPDIRMEFSARFSRPTASESIELAPGESRTLTWTIDSENIDLGQFIFAKALIYSAAPMPDQENTCGVLVLSTAGKGVWITAILTIICLFSLGGGSFLLYTVRPPLKQKNQILFVAGITLLLLAISFLGWWLQAVVLLAILVLMIVIMLGTFASG